MHIPETMRAVVKAREGRGAEPRTLPVPGAGPGEVLVRVRSCAICGTDVHIYQWNSWAAANVAKAYSSLPRILGHEFSGEVVRVGEGVTRVKIGDRVAAETHLPCGDCYLCRTGNGFNCQNIRRFKNGVYAEYALIPEFSCEKLPDSVSYEIGSMLEPFSVAVHGAGKARMVGDSVAVVGAGPIGLFTVKLARAMGAAKIFASDVSDYRLDLAKKAGADVVVNAGREDVVKAVREGTGGLGAGVVFEISGNVKATKQAFELLRKCGTMVMTGLPSEPLVLDAGSDIVWKAATIHGIHGRETFTSWEISKSLLASGVVEIASLATHRFNLFAEYEKAFELAEKGLAGKILLLPE